MGKKQQQPKQPKPEKDPFQPTEISADEYSELLQQVRTEFTEAECQGEMMDAARYDDIDVVRAILQVHPQLHQYKDANGNTPLHMAAANGHAKVVELMLLLGAEASTTNGAGNTPLHWASANGHDNTVQILLKSRDIDVLQQNQFGRSALTEGFTSENTDVVKSLLEHESATEERLIQNPNGSNINENSEDNSDQPSTYTHDLVFQGVQVRARELAMAESDKDTILGQVDPSDDTTGVGIWASSLVLAQWLVSQVKQGESWTKSAARVVELGAGCGVPSLALANAISLSKDRTASSLEIYATDFNPKTVDNLQHNIDINNDIFGETTTVKAMNMNWQDPATWPDDKVDCVIGSDLIYQSDMVPLLVDTITGLLKTNDCRFLYVARTDGERQGHKEFLARMEKSNFVRRETPVPSEYISSNPLASQDDDLCFLHFNELATAQYKLFEFSRQN